MCNERGGKAKRLDVMDSTHIQIELKRLWKPCLQQIIMLIRNDGQQSGQQMQQQTRRQKVR